jgi:hypothetical protein
MVVDYGVRFVLGTDRYTIRIFDQKVKENTLGGSIFPLATTTHNLVKQ